MNEHKSVPNIRFKGFEDKWKKEKLGNIATVEMNKRIYKDQTSEDGEIPFYKIGTFGKKADSFISKKLFDEYKKRYSYPKVGDILISASGTIGNTIIYKGEDAYFQDSNIVWLNVNHKIILNSFLYNFYKIVHWKGLEGSTIKRLYNSNILSTSINYPSITEQQKIGDFFAELDKLLDLQQQKINKLELLKKALLQKLFPKHDAKIPELRFQGFEDDWNEKRLNSITKRLDSYRKPITANKRLPGQTPYYGANGIQDYVKGYTHEGEFVLIAEDGANDVKNYPVRFVKGYIWVNNHAHVLQAKVGTSNNLFLAYSLKNRNLLPYLVGSGRMKLNADVLMNLLLKIPSFKEQQKIGNLLSKVDQLIELENKKLQNLQQIKKCLLQNMFVE